MAESRAVALKGDPLAWEPASETILLSRLAPIDACFFFQLLGSSTLLLLRSVQLRHVGGCLGAPAGEMLMGLMVLGTTQRPNPDERRAKAIPGPGHYKLVPAVGKQAVSLKGSAPVFAFGTATRDQAAVRAPPLPTPDETFDHSSLCCSGILVLYRWLWLCHHSNCQADESAVATVSRTKGLKKRRGQNRFVSFGSSSPGRLRLSFPPPVFTREPKRAVGLRSWSNHLETPARNATFVQCVHVL